MRRRRAAIHRFEGAAKQSLLSVEPRLYRSTEIYAPYEFSTLARCFDLSVLLQSEPDAMDNNAMIEASLFDSGRPVCIVPCI
jgi:hypothetical protein